MKKFTLKKISLLSTLVLIFVFTFCINGITYAENLELSTVVACSDFQEPNSKAGDYESYKNGQNLVREILDNTSKKYAEIEGFIACGDYCKEHPDTESETDKINTDIGVYALEDVVKEYYPMTNNFLYVQGNHDSEGSKIAKYGKNEFEKYSTFALNENNFYEENERTEKCNNDMKEIANDLNKYLTEKIDQKYDKPIFVCSHVPLHYSARTIKKKDGLYSQYLFDVINQAADKLNIVFLFGHNHNNGYDDVIGGSTSFLRPGDPINLCNLNDYNYVTKTLNFTYMNAGYVGYYEKHDDDEVPTFLNISSISFDENKLIINRWKQGQKLPCNLKAQGVEMKVKKSKSPDGIKHIIPADTTVYSSNQIIKLKHFNNEEAHMLDTKEAIKQKNPNQNETNVLSNEANEEHEVNTKTIPSTSDLSLIEHFINLFIYLSEQN